MATRGLEGLVFETHNWGKSVAFWQALGYELEFETDHGSGRLRHPAGGPYIFVAERPEGDALETRPIVGVDDADAFEAPASATVVHPFTPEHWGVLEMIVRDPDGRIFGLQAPLPAPVEDLSTR